MPVNEEWPPYCRWRLFDQDVIADLGSIRRELQFLRTSNAGVPDAIVQDLEKVIDACAEEVGKHFFFTNRIFIRQSLAEVRQELILIMPRSSLDSVWMALKNKLESIEGDGKQDSVKKSDQKNRDTVFEEIDDFFESEESTPSEECRLFELRVRRHMRAIRKHVDDRLLAELLSASSLQRSAKILVTQLSVLVLTIIIFLHKNHVSTADQIPNGWSTPEALQMSLFGALGGTLSAIVRPTPGKNSNEGLNLPMTRFSFMRPLLGGISGLVLFLLFVSGVINLPKLPYLGACVLALAFGFSERALIGVLSSTANRIDLDITRAMGQAGSSEKVVDAKRKQARQNKPQRRSGRTANRAPDTNEGS
jgi:hypothetical protein